MLFFAIRLEWKIGEVKKMTNQETTQKTKAKIAATLRSLMSVKPFSKITVSEIVKLCGINRKTFYYHFEDMFSLLRWMLEQETTAVVREINLNEDYPHAISFIMDYVERNSHILCCALDSASGYTLHRTFVDDFMQISLTVIRKTEEKYGVMLSNDRRTFLASFYAEAVAGLLMAWIRDKKSRNRDLVEQHIGAVIRDSLIGVLTTECE